MFNSHAQIGKRRLFGMVFIFVVAGICVADEPGNDLSRYLRLRPDLEAGKERFRACTKCHGTEGWGAYSGEYPQIAGQHASVVIKQLTDIRAGRRENPKMLPAAQELIAEGPQAVVDVASYVATLKMNPDPDVGDADDEDLQGTAETYAEVCSDCHGVNGEGNGQQVQPLLQGMPLS